MTQDDEEPSAASAGSAGRTNLATVDLFHAEIARLHGVNDRLRSEIERLRAMAFNPVTLTDAERYAVMAGLRSLEERLWRDPENLGGEYRDLERYAATLRGLLKRLAVDRPEPINGGESDRPKPIESARLAALEELSALDQKLELEYGLTGNPMIKGQQHTPQAQPTPNECTVPPEWTSKPYWVDPPSGHRYGFPRLYDPAADGDMTEWMIRQGYPEQLARRGVVCTFTACDETGER